MPWACEHRSFPASPVIESRLNMDIWLEFVVYWADLDDTRSDYIPFLHVDLSVDMMLVLVLSSVNLNHFSLAVEFHWRMYPSQTLDQPNHLSYDQLYHLVINQSLHIVPVSAPFCSHFRQSIEFVWCAFYCCCAAWNSFRFGNVACIRCNRMSSCQDSSLRNLYTDLDTWCSCSILVQCDQSIRIGGGIHNKQQFNSTINSKLISLN